MPPLPGTSRFNLIAPRWHALALRRMRFYEELYRSGRWTLYYPTREQFALHMLEVIKTAKIWAKLAGAPPPAARSDDFQSAA